MCHVMTVQSYSAGTCTVPWVVVSTVHSTDRYTVTRHDMNHARPQDQEGIDTDTEIYDGDREMLRVSGQFGMVPLGEENTHGDGPCSIGRQRVMSGTRDGWLLRS